MLKIQNFTLDSEKDIITPLLVNGEVINFNGLCFASKTNGVPSYVLMRDLSGFEDRSNSAILSALHEPLSIPNDFDTATIQEIRQEFGQNLYFRENVEECQPIDINGIVLITSNWSDVPVFLINTAHLYWVTSKILFFKNMSDSSDDNTYAMKIPGSGNYLAFSSMTSALSRNDRDCLVKCFRSGQDTPVPSISMSEEEIISTFYSHSQVSLIDISDPILETYLPSFDEGDVLSAQQSVFESFLPKTKINDGYYRLSTKDVEVPKEYPFAVDVDNLEASLLSMLPTL